MSVGIYIYIYIDVSKGRNASVFRDNKWLDPVDEGQVGNFLKISTVLHPVRLQYL